MGRCFAGALVGLLFTVAAALPVAPTQGVAAETVTAVASFSILGDMVRQVGGDRVAVKTFIGPDGGVHDFEPTPGDAKRLAEADILFVNGLGLEGWLPRLKQASDFRGETVVATDGIQAGTLPEGHHGHDHGGEAHAPEERAEDHGHAGDGHQAHDEEAHGHEAHGHEGHGHEGHGHENATQDEAVADPHGWQSLPAAKIYVENIRDGLIAVDPDGRAVYEANAKAYLKEIDALDGEIRAAVEKIPEARRVVVTSHDAFGYFGREYGIAFLAPNGISSDSEASAKAVARIIDQVREQQIRAVFLENVSDPRLLQQIAEETGAKIGGTLYSDALSAPEGPAATYLAMMRHNLEELTEALQPGM